MLHDESFFCASLIAADASLIAADDNFPGSVQEGAFALAIKSIHYPGEIVVAR